jgi:beta-glucosidase-like glycosyl hydrolase/CubicO group peptidase (beta-lactamase class C family)
MRFRRWFVLAILYVAPVMPAQKAADVLAGLSLERKAGQLFMSWILARATATEREQMRSWIADPGLGGVIVSLGTAAEAADLVAELQRAAEVPLLMASDFEAGVGYRLAGATDFGSQMLVGASGSAALARAMGEVTGTEAKALGFHWCFAPVLDVNVNPKNPIIGVRSFGSDPAAVARLGAAFAAGVRSTGVLPCGKHFPGHGDVSVDSHQGLAAVPGDRARLDAVELLPFRTAFAEGLESVMTGHLSVPGLGEDAAVPATLSGHILGDVLRKELGFRGLCVTDALDMGGVKGALPPGEVAVRALLAGADVLLMPPDPGAARDAVAAAVRSGRLPQARLDDAVLKILAAKEALGLLGKTSPRRGPVRDWQRVLADPAHRQLAEQIAAEGLTLVRDPQGLVPSGGDGIRLLVTVTEEDVPATGSTLRKALDARRELRLHRKSSEAEVKEARAVIAEARSVVLALHGNLGSGDAMLVELLQGLRADQRVTVLSFGNPYVGALLPAHASWVCGYAATPVVEAAMGRALLGKARVTGRLPVALPEAESLHAGLSSYALAGGQPLPRSPDPELQRKLRELLAQSVADTAFPGAVCMVARSGALVAEVAVGRRTYDANAPAVKVGDRFDLASLTKMCATAPAVLALAAAGKLSLDDPVQKWLPAFTGEDKEKVTLRHLLAHCAGLPAFERYYQRMQGRDAIVAAACAEELCAEPGERTLYSDLGFILLMAVVEKCSGEPFADYVHKNVLLPLGMDGAGFAPLSGPAADALPTEYDAARGGLLVGRVHDENAFAMGGVSGHAGLFGRAEDVLRLGLCWMGGGGAVLPRPLVQQGLRPAGLVKGDDSRGLGVERLHGGGWGGTTVPRGAFGHTGFTGTSLWCEPISDVCVVLLTNRVHPSRVNARIADVRHSVHDLVLSSIPR